MDFKVLSKLLNKKQMSLKELSKAFNISEEEAKNELKNLIETGLIFETNGYYGLCSKEGYILGKIVLRKRNFAYVTPINPIYKEDLRVSNSSLTGFILNDLVYLLKDFNGLSIVGLYYRNPEISGNLFKGPDGKFQLHSKLVEDCNVSIKIKTDLSKEKLSDGDLVKCKIVDFDEKTITVEFEELLVKANTVGADISSIIVNHDAHLTFPKDVSIQAKMLPQEVTSEDLEEVNTGKRVDYRNLNIVTIDGEDALDFDDAIYVSKITNGYQIGVHIADVSHYVKENSPIDEEAAIRGTSIYVADRVVPMLPFELSNGICSLNPNVDRLTLSVIMKVSNDGEVYDFDIHPGIINSHARLTYKQVNDLFNAKDNNLEYKADFSKGIEDMLLLAREATSKIRKRRERYGALDLDSTELKFRLDEKGQPIEIIKREQGEGEKLIEDLMIIANVSVAKFLANRNIPTLFRIHDNPPEDKIKKFETFLKFIGLYANFPKIITSSSLSNWYSSIEDENKKKAVSNFLLRSLAKAKYSPNNDGHFGLAEDFYLHFTSPIRRYPDLLVHRTLHRFVFEHEKLNYSSYYSYLTNMGISTSASERRAVDIEREVDDLESCKYMSKHLNETFKGYINSFTEKGIYLELENGVDAFLAIDQINPEKKYTYSAKHFDIVAQIQKSKQSFEKKRIIPETFKLGQEMTVIINKITFEDKTIHVVTPIYQKYLETYQDVLNKQEEEEKEISSRPDYSRFKNKHPYKGKKKSPYKEKRSFSKQKEKRSKYKNNKGYSKGKKSFKKNYKR